MSRLIPDPPHVLFVSSDALLRNRVGEALYSGGLVPLLAAHAYEAVTYLASASTPALIVLDLDTPGLDPAKIIERFRADARWSRARIVVTGSPLPESLRVDGVLPKPFDVERLVNLVRGR